MYGIAWNCVDQFVPWKPHEFGSGKLVVFLIGVSRYSVFKNFEKVNKAKVIKIIMCYNCFKLFVQIPNLHITLSGRKLRLLNYFSRE